jgi:hypothetical protein
LDDLLIGGSCILQPEGHGCVFICSKGGDERLFDLLPLERSGGNTSAVEEEEQDAASRRVDDLVDAWERKGILRTMFVEISIIHTHPSFISIHFSRLVQG